MVSWALSWWLLGRLLQRWSALLFASCQGLSDVTMTSLMTLTLISSLGWYLLGFSSINLLPFLFHMIVLELKFSLLSAEGEWSFTSWGRGVSLLFVTVLKATFVLSQLFVYSVICLCQYWLMYIGFILQVVVHYYCFFVLLLKFLSFGQGLLFQVGFCVFLTCHYPFKISFLLSPPSLLPPPCISPTTQCLFWQIISWNPQDSLAR